MLLYARPTEMTMIIGFVPVVIGEIIRIWGISYAGGETRTRKAGASNLVTQGPFSYLRNPLYFGNIVIYIGIAFMANTFFPFMLIAVFLFSCLQYYYIVVDTEEPKLKELFKDTYDEYTKSVKRFVPGSAYDSSKQSKLKFDIKAGWKSEKRTFQSMFTMVLMVLLIYILSHQ
jgi:protein-S-isoprenylcysteine O-methyltransferase Ste14